MTGFKWMLAAVMMGTAATAAVAGVARGDELRFKDELVPVLVRQVPELLGTYDEQSGRFGEGIWISTDQNRMYPLAVAWATEHDENPYYHDAELLKVLMAAGDALIDDADANGQWVFRKKDGSTWGKIWMPWTYSRWVRTFALIHDAMPAERRQRWVKALRLGYTGISAKALGHVHNIPAHHAMGLYVAGKALDEPAWCEQAAGFLMKVIGEQAEGGYWSENVGPVVNYNRVYLDALGTYYALSRDRRALAAIEKGVRFHYHFRYPDGSPIETIDERNPYHAGVDAGNVAFTFTPLGRAYLAEQWAKYGRERLAADLIASLLLYGEEGEFAERAQQLPIRTFVLTEGGVDRAAVIHRGPWCLCLSAYTAPIPKSRWIQDRQNLVSIFHEKIGLLIGGGNTKLQPAWSTFTVGPMEALHHRPGDTSPEFLPDGELYHVPSEATPLNEAVPGLDLTYGPVECRVRVRPVSDRELMYIVEAAVPTTQPSGRAPKLPASLPIMAHLTLMPHLGEMIKTGAGREATLGEETIDWSPADLGGELTYAGCRLHLPDTASLHWPALPHNPYRKDGRATPAEARIELRIRLDNHHPRETVRIKVE